MLGVLVIIAFFIIATPGVDWRVTSGRLAFNEIRTYQCLSISTLSDRTFLEGTETFIIQLQAFNLFLPPSVELARTNATVFILDNGMSH